MVSMSLRCLLADSDEDEMLGKTQEDDITENTDSTEAEAQLLLSIALVSPPLPQSPSNDKERENGNESRKSPASPPEHATRHLEKSLPTPATSSPCSSDIATQGRDDSQHWRNPQHHSSSFSLSHHPLISTGSKSNTSVNTSRQKDNASFPRPVATNPTIPNMVILKDLNELDTGMVCEYCKCTYSMVDTLKKHIYARHGPGAWKASALLASSSQTEAPSHPIRHPLQTAPSTPSSSHPSPLFTSKRPGIDKRHTYSGSRDSKLQSVSLQSYNSSNQVTKPPIVSQIQPRRSISSSSHPPSAASLEAHNNSRRKDLKLLPKLPYLPSPEDGRRGSVAHSTASSPSKTGRLPLPSLRPRRLELPTPSILKHLKLPPLKMALVQDRDRDRNEPDLETSCSACRQRGTPCLRNGHINVCRSCQDIGTLCDLPPVASVYRHRGTSTRLPSLRTKQLPSQQEQRPAPKSSSQQLPSPAPPFPAEMLEVHPTKHQTRSHAPIPSSSSSRFKSSMRVIQISEEDDKYKLPKASLPAPPPDAPAFSPPFTAAAHPFGISPPRIPIPFTPGVHPPVFKPRSRAASPVVNTPMSVLPMLQETSRSHSIAHVLRYEDWPKESRSGSRNYTDPFLLPPIQNVPYQNRSPRTDILHRSSHRDQEQRQQQEVRALEQRPPIVPTPLLQDQPYHAGFAATVLQRGAESRRAYLTDVLHQDPNFDVHKRWFGGISNSNDPSYAATGGNKRRHSNSPDEALSPEDLRGTSAKRTRVTEGYWAPRRPQSACESCRAKKQNCTVRPGQIACDRCLRKMKKCDLPPAMLQLALAQKDPSIADQCPPIQAVGEQDLFRKTSYEEYVPASFATITDLDWKELRGKCVEDMCTVLANLDQQLWEDFKGNMPEWEQLRRLVTAYFVLINPSFPVVHAATFDVRSAPSTLSLSLACLSLQNEGAFTAACIIREALLAALDAYTPERSEPSVKPLLAVEQAILLLSAFTIMPKSGSPSQWPRDLDNFLSRLCPSSRDDTATEDWNQWAHQEQRIRTAFGFYYISMFRHVFTYDADHRQTSPRLPGQHLPAPEGAWIARSTEEWETVRDVAKLSPGVLVTQVLRKADDRFLTLTQNTFHIQVDLLRQAYVERSTARMVNMNGGQLSESSLREQGQMATARMDNIFASPTINKLPIHLWKPDILALFLLHQLLILTRIQPITSLCEFAQSSATFRGSDSQSTVVQEREQEQSFRCLWRAALILQAIQQSTSEQRQQLIVPYALFTSVMFLCASPGLPTPTETRMPSTLIHLAAHWDANEGELHKWIYGRLKRLPAICLRSVNNSINVLSPETRVRLLQESIELMDDFRLPDRAARSFRDLLRLRAEAEQTKLQDLAAKRQ